MIEALNTKAIGRWRDTLYYANGVVQKGQWNYNQIQDDSGIITAGALTGKLLGFQYLALGEGSSTWDTTPPTIARTQTQLEAETQRLPIPSIDSISYLHPTTGAVSGAPTRRMEFTVMIPATVLGDFREFGLVGGDATSTLNTGYLFNHVAHAVISKDSGTPLEIARTIDIKWLNYDECLAL